MKVVITKEDVDTHLYSQYNNCPMAAKMRELLGKPIGFMHKNVYDLETGSKIGTVNPGFYAHTYGLIKKGELVEFETEYTPINN